MKDQRVEGEEIRLRFTSYEHDHSRANRAEKRRRGRWNRLWTRRSSYCDKRLISPLRHRRSTYTQRTFNASSSSSSSSYMSHCSSHSGEHVFSRVAVTNFSLPMPIVQNGLIPKRERHVRSLRSTTHYHRFCLCSANCGRDSLNDSSRRQKRDEMPRFSYRYNWRNSALNSISTSFDVEEKQRRRRRCNGDSVSEEEKRMSIYIYASVTHR